MDEGIARFLRNREIRGKTARIADQPHDLRRSPSLDFDQMRDHAHQAAALLKTLANDKPLVILCALAKSEASVGQLNRVVPLSQSALSQHLGVLRRHGLVQTRRQSQTIVYSLTESGALRLIRTLHDIYCD